MLVYAIGQFIAHFFLQISVLCGYMYNKLIKTRSYSLSVEHALGIWAEHVYRYSVSIPRRDAG